jgi:NAD(P)-dependent dehydrogenase (short-subunit alcohol dehydrogenase family)
MTKDDANATTPVALITAGAAGIGRVMAEAFIAQGYRVHVCDSDQAAIDSLLQVNPDITTSRADVSDIDQVAQVFADLVEQQGRLDVLINNVGIAGPTAHVENIDPADWDRTIAVNLSGHFYSTRQAIPLLRQSRGSITNIASNAAFTGCPGRAPYAASKWGIIGLTKTLAMELGPDGIRVNAICPASVDGDRLNGVIERDAQRRGQTVEAIRDVYLRQSSLRTFINFSPPTRLRKFPGRRSVWTDTLKHWRTGWTDESSMV